MNSYQVKEQIKKKFSKLYQLYRVVYADQKQQKNIEKKNRALRETGLETAQKVEKALQKTDLVYFMDFGTLLGIVRDQKMIDHDLDMDYGVVITEATQWKVLEDALATVGMKKISQYQLDSLVVEQTYRCHDLTIDFFLHQETENGAVEYGCYKMDDYDYPQDNQRHIGMFCGYPFQGTQQVQIGENLFTIPNEAEQYLESIYGQGWRIPDPSWKDEMSPAWRDLTGKWAYGTYWEK